MSDDLLMKFMSNNDYSLLFICLFKKERTDIIKIKFNIRKKKLNHFE